MKLKNIFASALCSILIISTVSCGIPQIEGDTLINQAREDYASLNSAQVIMTNMDTNEIEQTFTFKYDEKDTLIFSYYGKSEKTEYAQFNNGAECYTYDNGTLTHTVKGDKNFQRYTRDAVHPQASESLLIFDPKAITAAEVKEENGITRIRHIYDVSKINAQGEEGEVTGFSAEYYFDKNKKLMYFVEVTIENVDGKEKKHSIKVEITKQNAVNRVENTTKQFQN